MNSKQEVEDSCRWTNFDFIFAGLLSMRLGIMSKENPELHLRFELKSNFTQTEPFCDMSVNIQWRDNGGITRMTYFVYLLNSECKLEQVSRFYQRIYRFIKDSSRNKYYIEANNLLSNSRFLLVYFSDVFENKCCKFFSSTSEIVFPFADVFHSGVGKMLYFSKRGKKIFKQYDGIERQDLNRVIILRLSILSCPASSEELCSLLEDCTVRTLGPTYPHIKKTVEYLLKILRRKWHQIDGYPFSDKTSELYEAIAEFSILEENNSPLTFKEVECDTVKSYIRDFHVIYVKVPGISRDIRGSKVTQVLKNFLKERPGKQNNFLILSERTFYQYPVSILECVCKHHCDILVLNIDQTSAQLVSFLRRILNNVRKIVILSEQFIPKIQNVLRSAKRKKYVEFVDKWTLCQLSEFAERKLVRRKVNFQGRDISLLELEDSWPSMRNHISGATLNRLQDGDIVCFGSSIGDISFDKSYINRKVEHRAILKNDIFQLCSASDYFLLTGFPEEFINDVIRSKDFWVEIGLLEPENVDELSFLEGKRESKHATEFTGMSRKTIWSVWESDKEPQMIRNANQRNIHWLEYKSGMIVWKSTYGNGSVIEQFLDKPFDSCHENNACVHNDYELISVKIRKVIISGKPGMGKTALLRRIAVLFKELTPFHWVIFVPISRQKLLQNFPSCLGFNEVVQLLELCVRQEDSIEHGVNRYFIKDCLENSGRIVILVDGIDELDPQEKERALCVLKVLSETRAAKLFVSVRTSATQDISKILNCVSLKLLPYSEKDQHCHVLSNMAKDLCRNETKSFKKRVEHLLDIFRTATGNKNVCSVPLYLKLLLETYKSEEFQTRLKDSSFPKNPIDILYLYSIYLLRACRCFNFESNLYNQAEDHIQYLEQLEKYAATICSKYITPTLGFKPSETTLSDLLKICEMDQAKLIIQNYHGRPEFVHHTFKEYLLASWCKKNYKSRPNVVKCILKDYSDTFRYFLDAMLSEEKQLHQLVLNREVEMLATALQAECGVNDRDNGGRTALHLAASNGCSNAILLLLKAEAEVSLVDDVMHWTPLSYADQFLHLEAADWLLSAGANRKDIHNIRTQFISGRLKVSELLQKDLVYILKVLVPNTNLRLPCGREKIPKILKNISEIAVVSGSTNVTKMLMNFQRDINEKINGLSPLHLSAFSGNYELTQMFLNNGAAFGEFDDFGETPLHKAVRCGHISICKALLKFGADPDVPDASGKTPIFLALHKDRSKDLLELLLQYNAKLDTKTSQGATILLAASRAGNEDICKFLLRKGSDANICDFGGTTPLHVASEKGYYEICCLLLQNGANVNSQDSKGQSSLHRVLKSDQCTSKICKLLLRRGADVNLKDNMGISPLFLSIRKKRDTAISMLLENKPDLKSTDSEKRTILHEAVLSQSTFFSVILERITDINCKDIHGNTPLYLSSKLGYEEICRLLLQKNANVNLKNNCGKTVLHVAAGCGYLWICRLLLENGAILNSQDCSRKTPLHYASSGGHETVCRLLLEQGANPNCQDTHKKTPLFSAVRGKEVVCRMLLDFGADATIRDENGKTLLHYAASHGQESICNILLMQRVDVNACDRNKRSVLRAAVSNNQRDLCEFLLNRGADVNHKDAEGATVLMIASKSGNEELCRLLLENGANVNERDNKEKTALSLAANGGYNNVCQLLLEYGSNMLISSETVVCSENGKDSHFSGGNVRILGFRRSQLIKPLWCCSCLSNLI